MKLECLLLGMIAASTSAQQLTPVWEFLVNQPGAPVSVLTNSVPYATDLDLGDGKSLMDSLGPLIRYDQNRLLLGIRENGIDETAAGANTALAAQFPDRSLIWINPTNGAPIGIALTIGLYPVALDADFLAAGGSTNQYWWTWTLGEDGAIYTGYKNKILRYPSNGSGGFNTTPTTVFTLPQSELEARSIDPTLWANWRWGRIHSTGTGANVVILAGTTSGARGTWRLTTTDGNAFTAGSFLNVAGASSTPIPSRDSATPDDTWVYAGLYPGNSNGADSSYSRYTATPPFTENFTRDASFAPSADPFTYPVKYRNDFTGGIDANTNLNYFVVYSTPSWNSRAVVTTPRPGWLALVGHDGRFLSSHLLNVTEDAELLSGPSTSIFQGTWGYVSLDQLADGSVEVLWSGTIYGYGRYRVIPFGPQPQVPQGGSPPGPFPGNTVGAANWIASGGAAFDATVSIGQDGQGPVPWSISRYDRGDFAVRLSPLNPVAAQDNFGLLQEFPGEGTAAIPSEQAWRPSAEAGIIIPTVRTNGPIDWGDGIGAFYPVIAASVGASSGYGYNMVDGSFGTGGTDIQTGKAGDQSANPSPEGNFDFATTWFPYHQGWIGAAVENPDASGNARFASENSHSSRISTNDITWPASASGSALLSIPGASTDDGMIFATSTQAGSDVKIISVAPRPDKSAWVVTAHRASDSDPVLVATDNAQFQFVYIPYNSSGLIGGHIAPGGTVIKSNGTFTIEQTLGGVYALTIPGKTGTNGVLLLQNANLAAGSTNIADNTFLSYSFVDGKFVINGRRTAAANTFPLTATSFYFSWIDFSTPLQPPPSTGGGNGQPPRLNVARSGSTATITWDASANGFTLEKTAVLGPNASWTSLGVVGQGALTTGYTVPAGVTSEFYRLKK